MLEDCFKWQCLVNCITEAWCHISFVHLLCSLCSLLSTINLLHLKIRRLLIVVKERERRYLHLNELLWSNNNKWLTSPALQHNETVWYNCTMLSYCTQDGPCPVTLSWHMSLAAVCKPLKHWVNRNHNHDCHENDDYNIKHWVLSIHINNSFLCTWPENKKECWCWHMVTSCPGVRSCVTRP